MRYRLLALLLAALFVALPARAVEIEWVLVGDPGNPPDTATNCFAADCGSVPYRYYISKYEITKAQYVEFLNAVAASDPLGLYNTRMGSDATVGGIKRRRRAAGGYTYTVKAGFEDKPVVYVSFYDAVRFANWLHNGQPTGAQAAGTTEDGAYAITADGIQNNTITRTEEAAVFLPSENEWYKAAYYAPALPGYHEYPAGTNTATTCTAPGAAPNTANCESVVGALTDVGSYTGSASPYGTFDQGGNVMEWNEEIARGSSRGVRGGSWFYFASDLGASVPGTFQGSVDPSVEGSIDGFRVAALVPEPAHVLLVLTGGLVLAAARRRRA